MGKSRALKIAGWLLAITIPLLAFVAASSLVASTPAPRWLSWCVGLAVFPVGPGLYCAIAEFRRRGRGGTLTLSDRLLLRVLGFDGLVLLLLGVVWGTRTLNAAMNHGLWWLGSDPAPVVERGSWRIEGGGATSSRAPLPTSSGAPRPPKATSSPRPSLPAPVDAECRDGKYREALPKTEASIDDLITGYDPAELNAFVLGILDRRYPVGALLVRGGKAKTDCVAAFTTGRTDSAHSVLIALSTVTHECGHMHDLRKLRGAGLGHVYQLSEDNAPSCRGGGMQGLQPRTFARSAIINDAYADKRRQCSTGQAQGCDSYARIYLTGTSGKQGLNMLVEELVQYVHGLATASAVEGNRGAKYQNASSSERDGVLTFLWYLQRYLRLARTEHPKTYAKLLADDCWRGLLLDLWGRAWLYLDRTAKMPRLGIDAAELEALVRKPELLGEISRLRKAEGCDSTSRP